MAAVSWGPVRNVMRAVTLTSNRSSDVIKEIACNALSVSHSPTKAFHYSLNYSCSQTDKVSRFFCKKNDRLGF